jgi:response regulator RpfG family c-di-GMP phosphodiesterase
MSSAHIEIAEASNGAEALDQVRGERPDVVVLDVEMPGIDGLAVCVGLKADPATIDLPVVILTGGDIGEDEAAAAGADAFLRKPFSPLQLLAVIEQLAGGSVGVPFRGRPTGGVGDALLLYARDLRHVLEIERGQRTALQAAYAETVMVLANALESKDTGTGAHSQRVQRYASVVASHVGDQLQADPSVEYGFLLHDVGKIGIPDVILQKPGPLTSGERALMQTHTVLGQQMLGGVAYLQGEGLRIVRSHHERRDGDG